MTDGWIKDVEERAKALGIERLHLYRALDLIRNLRIQTMREGLNPRATRIALIFANSVDFHEARKVLSEDELKELETIASVCFRELCLRMEKKGVR